MNTNQAKEKIRKLLALAQDKSNENEAEAALLAARKLMAQHKLTDNDLEEGKPHELREVTYDAQTFSGLRAAWMISLAKTMAEYHCCFAAMRGTRGSTVKRVLFAGLDDDPEIVLTLFDYAVQHIQKTVAEYRKRVLWNVTDQHEKNDAARSFEQSYADGFREGIRAKYELPFRLLADTTTQMLQDFGAWGEKKMYGKTTMGTLRRTFIFDENGILERIIEKVDTKNAAAQILT